MLVLDNISKSYGDRILFQGLSLTAVAGNRIALIGANGSGKSTLMDIISNEMPPDEGRISVKKDIRVGYLKQDNFDFTERTLLEEVLDEPESLNSLREQMTDLQIRFSDEEDVDKQTEIFSSISEISNQIEVLSHDSDKHEAERILSGLGFRESDFSRKLNEFSGGWVMRASLSKLLFKDPDVLLLDEPTNHLDLASNIWFEKYLQSFKGAVILTSHDRVFLNSVATSILAIEPDEIVFQKGTYEDYVEYREESIKLKEATAARLEKQIAKQMKFVDRFRYTASKASQVQSRIKALEKIEKVVIPRTVKKIHYSFPSAPRSGYEVIKLSEISKSYGTNQIYNKLNLVLNRGDKVALVGPNGAGKSTLLKIMAEALEFDSGERKLGHNVIEGYYAQHLLELLNPSNTIMEEVGRISGLLNDQDVRNVMGGFLFRGDDIYKPISVLSGGEKARVALAKLLLDPSNLLFMDEPTNHLDIASREILSDALQDYEGTLCFITHDRGLIHQIANKVIEIQNGVVNVYNGTYSEYLYHKDNLIRSDSVANDFRSEQEDTGTINQTSAKESQLLYKNVRQLEDQIARKDNEISELELLFADPSNFETSDVLNDVSEKYEVLKKEYEVLWNEFESLSSRLELLK
ncbi:MAG: ABC-F family ATP-binding cassette domain-containing protein [Dehalococcoidia bacterium]